MRRMGTALGVGSPADEALDLAADLVRTRTVNPPGNELAAAQVLGDYLGANGISFQLAAKAEHRANLVARLRGRGGGPSLLLLSHLDTASADASEWSVDPWAGVVADGSLWGRGALDLKGQTAAQAVALAGLVRESAVLQGDVVTR